MEPLAGDYPANAIVATATLPLFTHSGNPATIIIIVAKAKSEQTNGRSFSGILFVSIVRTSTLLVDGSIRGLHGEGGVVA